MSINHPPITKARLNQLPKRRFLVSSTDVRGTVLFPVSSLADSFDDKLFIKQDAIYYARYLSLTYEKAYEILEIKPVRRYSTVPAPTPKEQHWSDISKEWYTDLSPFQEVPEANS